MRTIPVERGNIPSLLHHIGRLAMVSVMISSCTKKLTMEEALSAVNGDSIKAHIAFLADDSLKGRLPGTAGYDAAVGYVVSHLKQYGLEPAGNAGTYLQELTIRKGFVNESESSLSVGSTTWTDGKDYVFIADLNSAKSAVTAPVVFVGYGIEYGTHSDYRGVNVEGKIVVVMTGAPDSLPATELAHFSNFATKFESAIRNGAIGMILTSTRDDAFQRATARYEERGNSGVVSPTGEVYGRTVFGAQLKFVAVANWNSMREIFGEDPDRFWASYERNPAPRELKPTIFAATSTTYMTVASQNIVAKLKGSDASRRDEVVVFSAHLDHVGIGKPVDGDSIYNGAHDNASGVACVMEIARLYPRLAEPPKRSILFVLTTAEEMGLLGSEYFTRFPTVPADQMVANVNMDMPTIIAPLLSIEPLGAEHSSLMKDVQEAASKLDLEVMPDHNPKAVRFIRSDQYNFVLRGIPALHIKYGLKSADSIDLAARIKDFTDHTYHKPSDELNESFDFNAAETYVKLNFLVSYSVAQAENRPAWNEGDVFARAKN